MMPFNIYHIEFLLDKHQTSRDINKLSATKQQRFNELQAAGYVCLHEDIPYARLTESGEQLLIELEHHMNGRPE